MEVEAEAVVPQGWAVAEEQALHFPLQEGEQSLHHSPYLKARQYWRPLQGSLRLLQLQQSLQPQQAPRAQALKPLQVLARVQVPVLEAAVIGVPDAKWGEVGAAFLLLRPGQTVDVETLRPWCRERLAGYKVPATVRIVEDFPRTAAGKVRKPDLREMMSDA